MKLFGKLRRGLKIIVDAVAEHLEDKDLQVADDPLMDSSHSECPAAGQPEIVEHPQYWVESNFTEAQSPDVTVKATDVTRTVHRDAVKVIFDCIKIQLSSAVGPEEGAWRAWVKDDHMHVQIEVKYPQVLERVKTACVTAADNIRTHGIQFGQFPLAVNEKEKEAHFELPIKNVNLSIEAPLVWLVLHRNRDNPILWGGKLWLPKGHEHA